jgi:hypothetical protein
MISLQSKKRHHYVPQSYLKFWITNKEGEKTKQGIWTYNKQRRDTNFITDLNRISQINRFYKLDIDDDILDVFTYRYRDKKYDMPNIFEELDVLNKINKYKKSQAPCHEKLNVINNNYLEDKYEKVEKKFSPILNLIQKDISKYLSELKRGKFYLRDLVEIFSIQLFRTKKSREHILSEITSIYIDKNDDRKALSEHQRMNLLNLILFVEPLFFCQTLTKNEYSVEFLINNSTISFITSNSPALIINAQSSKVEDMSKFVGFIPLCPKVGMIIRGHRPLSKNLMIRYVNESEVDDCNKFIFNESDYDVYSSFEITDGQFN